MSKQFTAEELRAESAELVDMLGEHNTAASMLRYAADVVDRCKAEIAKLPYLPNADDVYMFKRLNHILRGNARKEGK